ncbi:hypothetical protein L195_g021409 [Trifolium pratense]|uniref:RNase H type-1 domain-containing protein n=1 Tax=Trifolium pratense TaxID=57577 RepID=A0A2K3N553_TRIPR|nr:hypothetical protein L195_g021409 [Trifolium pratense]
MLQSCEGCLEVLTNARRLGFTKIEFNVDSMVMAQVLRTRVEGSSLESSLIGRICRMQELEWEVMV